MKKGEIWRLDMGVTDGHEQAGIRPAVIIADVVGTVVTIIPCTSNLDALRFPFTVRINPDSKNGLNMDSIAITFQLRAIDKKRLKNKMGIISSSDMKVLNSQLKKMLGF